MKNKISDNLNNELDQFWIEVGILSCELFKQFDRLNEEINETLEKPNTNYTYTTEQCKYCNNCDSECEHYKEEEDVVNSPNHYKSGRLETIDNIRNSLSDVEFKGYLKGNIFKYVSRAELKNGVEDLNKTIKYIEFLKEEM